MWLAGGRQRRFDVVDVRAGADWRNEIRSRLSPLRGSFCFGALVLGLKPEAIACRRSATDLSLGGDRYPRCASRPWALMLNRVAGHASLPFASGDSE